MRRLKILVLSAGSLVGQNILDALEGRRHLVHVIGANNRADNPRLFRCDAAHLTPSTDDAPAFRQKLRELVEREQPDLVVAGRDHDVPFLGELREENPRLARKITAGPKHLADMIQDKWLSHLFCREQHLPFADSLLAGPKADESDARAFLARHGLPLVAKPRWGFGTHGTRIVFDQDQFLRNLRQPDYILQPFLAPPPGLREKFFNPADGWPFFHALQDDGQYAGQAIIGPEGEIVGDVWCHLCTMISGHAEKVVLCHEPAFAEITRQFARAAAQAGWRGPFNLQARKIAEGQFVGFELSGRMTGTTSIRRLLGYDEIGLMARAFAGVELPLALPPSAQAGASFVIKSLTDYCAPDAWVRELSAKGVWRASEN